MASGKCCFFVSKIGPKGRGWLKAESRSLVRKSCQTWPRVNCKGPNPWRTWRSLRLGYFRCLEPEQAVRAMNALGLIHALSADPASSNSTLRFEFALLFEFHVAGEFEGAPAGMFADVASTGVLVLERM